MMFLFDTVAELQWTGRRLAANVAAGRDMKDRVLQQQMFRGFIPEGGHREDRSCRL